MPATDAGPIPQREGRDVADIIAEKVADRVLRRLGETSAPDMLSPRTMARRLDCSVSEVRKMLQERRIPTVRFGSRGYRVAREEFESRLERWKRGGEFWD